MFRTIEVVEPNPNWPMDFTDEATKLESVFGDSLIAIHHIGSTSVPGLYAKPIIDILVVLRETDTIERFTIPMQALGYRVRGECLDAEVPGTPGRFFFSKDDSNTQQRTHHVHACAIGHFQIEEKLAFRDYLRTHAQRAAQYAVLKQRLALEHRHDSIGYMRGKDAFVKQVLAEALQWARSTAPGAVPTE